MVKIKDPNLKTTELKYNGNIPNRWKVWLLKSFNFEKSMSQKIAVLPNVRRENTIDAICISIHVWVYATQNIWMASWGADSKNASNPLNQSLTAWWILYFLSKLQNQTWIELTKRQWERRRYKAEQLFDFDKRRKETSHFSRRLNHFKKSWM